jgi:hypothetical protein
MNKTTTALYFIDNGEIACETHMGATARLTGRTITGQPVEKLTLNDRAEMHAAGYPARCEICGAH